MGAKAATYITDEDVKKVNALPGVDRQIVSVDIGKLNEAVGIVHRGTTRGASRRRPPLRRPPRPHRAASRWRRRRRDRRQRHRARPPDRDLHHRLGQRHADHRRPGRQWPPVGARQPGDNDPERPVVQRRIADRAWSRRVKTGDIIIIPAGVPHGWSDIADHVDYLTVRPDPDRVLKPYVHPVLQKK